MSSIPRLPIVVLFAFALLPASHAIDAQAPASAPAGAASVEGNRKALNQIFKDYWEDNLAHSPEFASSLGDKRWNDQIADYSVKAYNQNLEREQGFLMRLAAIDDNGTYRIRRKSAASFCCGSSRRIRKPRSSRSGRFPVNQLGGIQTAYPDLVAQLSFTTVKDYDDWIARLHLMPRAFEQVTANMALGIEDHNLPPKYLLDKVLAQVKEFAAQKPEDSPLACR